MKFRVQVNTYGDASEDVFTGNQIEHDTAALAKAAAIDLWTRWTGVRIWRVVDENDVEIVRGK